MYSLLEDKMDASEHLYESSNHVVAFLGKIGHGKTFLVNKLCGTDFASEMSAHSCTRQIQIARAQNGINIVDTPGFYSSIEILAHIEIQKLALETNELSGVYVIVKYGRTSDIAEPINKIMDFVGDDDLRIIVTHSDTVETQEGFDLDGMKLSLSTLLDIDVSHIAIVGKMTSASEILDFILSTLHHPKSFKISHKQIASIAGLCVGARQFNKSIDEVREKIQAAKKSCISLLKNEKSFETVNLLDKVQKLTNKMVKDFRDYISRASEDLTPEQQNILFAKVELDHSLALSELNEITNKNIKVSRKRYRASDFDRNHGFDKIQVPLKTGNQIDVEFVNDETGGWSICYYHDKVSYNSDTVCSTFAKIRKEKRNKIENTNLLEDKLTNAEKNQSLHSSYGIIFDVKPNVACKITQFDLVCSEMKAYKVQVHKQSKRGIDNPRRTQTIFEGNIVGKGAYAFTSIPVSDFCLQRNEDCSIQLSFSEPCLLSLIETVDFEITSKDETLEIFKGQSVEKYPMDENGKKLKFTGTIHYSQKVAKTRSKKRLLKSIVENKLCTISDNEAGQHILPMFCEINPLLSVPNTYNSEPILTTSKANSLQNKSSLYDIPVDKANNFTFKSNSTSSSKKYLYSCANKHKSEVRKGKQRSRNPRSCCECITKLFENLSIWPYQTISETDDEYQSDTDVGLSMIQEPCKKRKTNRRKQSSVDPGMC